MPNPFAQNPFFSMLGQQPQFGQMQAQQPQFGQQPGGQQQPQGPFGAARWLPGFLGQQGGGFPQQGGLVGGLAPWGYEVPTPEYIASFLASRPSAPQTPAQSPLVTAAQRRKANRPGGGGPGGAGNKGGSGSKGKSSHPGHSSPGSKGGGSTAGGSGW